MDRVRALVIFFSFSISSACYGGYAQLTPPPGWVAGTGAGALYQPPAASAWVNSKALADAAIASASGTSKIRVSLAVDRAAASRVLAGRVGTALLAGSGGPIGLGLTVGAMLVLPEAVEWWKQTGFRWNGNGWVEEERTLEGYWQDPYGNGQYASPEAACKSAWSFAAVERRSETNAACVANGGTLGNVFRVGKEIVKQKPVEYEPRVRTALEVADFPPALPNVVWPASWPVKDPVINPDSTGKPQPVFIPTGNPVKNPQYDSSKPISSTNQPFLQPGIRVTPAPAPGNPWRVDVQPVDKPVTSSNPDENKDPDDPESDKPQDTPSLCEKHPDIVACQKLGNIEPENVENKTVTLSINREEGFGPSNAACPAPRTVVLMGQSYSFSWELFCQFAEGIRPVVIGVAYLLAVLSFMGLSRRSD